jgi:hypothetical protein
MLRRSALLLLLPFAAPLAGCSHAPETVVHFSAPSPGAWTVRDHTGARLCALPCRVELEEKDSVVLARDNGTQFVVLQETLGPGAFDGTVKKHEEPSDKALVLRAFSDALVAAGGALLAERSESERDRDHERDHRRHHNHLAAGIVLTGLGTVGALASTSIHGPSHDELWLTKTASAAPEP